MEHNLSKLLVLKQVKARPKGSAFLGVSNCQVPANMLSPNGLQTDIIIDSGSDITLISLDTLSRLSPKPKPKIGEKIKLGQVSGELKIDSYVDIPLYFYTKQGPINLLVEAYVVPHMAPSFILGNDFAEQYQLSIIRGNKGTRLLFADTGRSMRMSNSTYSTEELHAYIAKYSVEAPIPLPPRKKPDGLPVHIYTAEPVTIPPHTGKKITLFTTWPEHVTEAFVETIPDLPENIQVLEAIITKETPEIIIFNIGKTEVILEEHQPIGRLLNARRVLNKSSDKHMVTALALKALVQGLGRRPEPVPEGHPSEMEGGSKVAEVPPDEVSSKEFLETIDFSPNLTQEQRARLEQAVLKHSKAFSLDGRLGKYASKVEIKLKEGSEPVSMRPYHASPMKREVIEKQIRDWLRLEVIEPSKSPWGFPIVIVFKNGKPRFCIDYRQLNSCTVADEYPLPRQTDILHALTGANWLSTFDALAGFNQLEIKEEDREKTAFRSHMGLHQFKRMPFGIQNGPANFQRVMNNILAAWLWIFVLVYIDDIVVFSKLFEEHAQHIETVLSAVEEAGLTLAPAKCHLGYQSLLLLGQKVSRLGISALREKVDAIDAIEPPTTVKSLQSFLGMMVYFSSYIPYYSWIVAPLFKLLRKGAEWTWKEEQQHAFEVSKAVLKSSPILAYPITGNGYRLYTDASTYGIAGVLQQIQKVKVKDLVGTRIYKRLQELFNNQEPLPNLISKVPDGFKPIQTPLKWEKEFEETEVYIERVIAYWSRVLKSAEQNYSPTELEALAAKEALVKFQAIVEGELIILITDHSALTWSTTYTNRNTRLTKWGTIFAAEPGLNIVHRAGRTHSNVDPLSRMKRNIPFFESPILDPSKHIELGTLEEELDARNWKKLTFAKEQERNATTQALWIDEIQRKPEELSKLLSGYDKDVFFSKIARKLRSETDWRNPQVRNFSFEADGLLYFTDAVERKRLCIPQFLVPEILQEHNHPNKYAHAAYQKTYLGMVAQYYWPTMRADVEEYCKRCAVCQKTKSRNHRKLGLLQPIPIPQEPMDVVTMDLITDLPKSNGFNGIFVAVDKLTKYLVIAPIKTSITELETAKLFKEVVITRFGMPRQVISDRDPRWRQEFWKELLEAMGSKRSLTTAHHPQADGQTEVANRILIVALRAYANGETWADFLQDFAMAYNSSVNTVTGYTPHYLLTGTEMRRPDVFHRPRQPLPREGFEKEETPEFINEMFIHRQLAQEAILLAQNAVQNAQNKKRIPFEFEVGDKVLINPHSLELSGDWTSHGGKLTARYEGPFEIIDKLGPLTYRLRLPPDWEIHPVLNIEHLEPWKEPSERLGQVDSIPVKPRRPNSKEDWSVEEIVAERRFKPRGSKKQILHYRAKWLYPDGVIRETGEWVRATDFANAPEVVLTWTSLPSEERLRRSRTSNQELQQKTQVLLTQTQRRHNLQNHPSKFRYWTIRNSHNNPMPSSKSIKGEEL